MKRILKYELSPPMIGTSIVEVQLPEYAQILSADAQGERLYIWALTSTAARARTQQLKVLGTGWPMDEDDLDDYDFLATVQMPEEGLVWHVWVRR